MKYWNKQKEVRERCWTKVLLHQDPHPYPSGYRGWNRYYEFDGLKRKLQNNPSKRKFYMMILNKEIWFECGADATWFMLTDYEKA